MITVTCAHCGTPFDRKPSDAAKSKKHFCGFSCYAAWQSQNNIGKGRKRVQVTCNTCGSIVEKQPCAVRKHNFCGRPCFHKWHEGQFSGANNGSWRGGSVNYRGPNWNKQSAAARRRDRDTCQRCGYCAPSLPVHHERPFQLFDSYIEANDLNNLKTLCPSCHSAAEVVFWRTHPELIPLRRSPDCTPVISCRTCGQSFTPRSPATQVCDACCSIACQHCGKTFYTRKISDRTPKYCSRGCRNAAIKRQSQTCEGCGVEYMPDRVNTRYCSNDCRMRHNNPRRKSSPTT